jgi:hypothetical protein
LNRSISNSLISKIEMMRMKNYLNKPSVGILFLKKASKTSKK